MLDTYWYLNIGFIFQRETHRSQSSQGGGAFVDTAQLDGESSLKPKHAVDETQHMIRNSSVHSVEGIVSRNLCGVVQNAEYIWYVDDIWGNIVS